MLEGEDGVPLPPPAAPRRGLRRDPEGRTLAAARALRRLARAARASRLDAFVGYHLEQAYRYRVELGDTGAESGRARTAGVGAPRRAAAARPRRSDSRRNRTCSNERRRSPPVPDAAARAGSLTELAATLMDAGRLDEAGARARRGGRPRQRPPTTAPGARLLVERHVARHHRATAGATEGVAGS